MPAFECLIVCCCYVLFCSFTVDTRLCCRYASSHARAVTGANKSRWNGGIVFFETDCIFAISSLHTFTTWQCWWRHYVFGLCIHSVCLPVRLDRSCYYNISWTSWTISMKRTGN